jgi:hypothetical protein
MKLKAAIMLALAALLTAPQMFGLQGMGVPAGVSKQEAAAKLANISSALQLTPLQKQQMLPILEKELPQLNAIKNNPSLAPAQKAMELKQIGSATDAQVLPILNPMQQEKWKIMRTEERQQMLQKLEHK